MTREEAIAVLEGLSDNPLFSNQYKAAFNIAIHDIKQRHDWDINNLILINKENYESAEQESNLGKIRAEIENTFLDDSAMQEHTVEKCLRIIDKCAESEEV